MKPVNRGTIKAELDRLLQIKKDFGQMSLRDEWLYECLFQLFEKLESPCDRPIEYMGTGKAVFPIDVIYSKQENKS